MSLAKILQDSAYRLTQFKPARIAALEAGITWKQTEKASTPYVTGTKLVVLIPAQTSSVTVNSAKTIVSVANEN
jgi:hypothetical protein